MRRLFEFCVNEDGSTTLWNLFWLVGLGLLMGVALDTTTAMHTKSRLQTVADTSAHAGVYDIAPHEGYAVATAVGYSYSNMPNVADVVNETDVTFGWWDHKTKTFSTNGLDRYNAVQVIATRDNARSNATATSFLGLIGFHAWDINAVAVAAALDITMIDCRGNALFAGGTMEQTSNNTVIGPICMYGDTSLKISQNNLITCGVQLIAPSPDHFHNGTPPVPTTGACNEDYGNMTDEEMAAQAMRYDTMPVVADLEYANAKAILEKFIAGQDYNDPFRVIPPYITMVASPSINTFNNLAKQGNLVPGTLYDVSCAGTNKKMNLEGFVQNVGIFTDCEVNVVKDKNVSAVKPTKTESGTNNGNGQGGTNNLCDPDDSTCTNVDWLAEITEGDWSCAGAIAKGFESYTTYPDTAGGGTYADGTTDTVAENCGIEPGANGLWDNVLLFTSHTGSGNIDQKAVTLPNNMQLGRIDGCTEGGGVRIYSAGSVHTPSGTTVHGLQIVTLGSVQLAAKANGAMGINIQAMGDVKYTANGLMGGCTVDPDAGASDVVITVRPTAIVR